MGIFDNKKKNKDDDLSGPMAFTPTTQMAPVGSQPTQAAASTAGSGRYGIDDAIALLRKLPQDNVELVVRVVRTTLESVKIHVFEIVRAAGERLQSLDARITAEKTRIAELEREIATRHKEIEKLQAEFDETESVKEKLLLAEEQDDSGIGGGSHRPPPPPPTRAPSTDNVIIELNKK